MFGWKTLGPNRISNRCAFNRNPRVSLLGHFPINGISLFSCRVKKSFSVSSLSGGTHFKVVPARHAQRMTFYLICKDARFCCDYHVHPH